MKLNIDDYTMDLGDKKVKVNGPYVNRDLSWLDFNARVLTCALNKYHPMNERLNFLAITESNLDEFISVRFANSYNNQNTEPYAKILKKIKKFKNMQNEAFLILKEEINKKYGYKFTKCEKLDKKEKDVIKNLFLNSIYPKLTPYDITTNNINLESGITYIAAIVKKGNYENLTVIPINKDIEPIYEIGKNIILVEDIICYFLNSHIFINQTITDYTTFKVNKDFSVILSHDRNTFIVDRMEDTLYNRLYSKPLFLQLKDGTDERLEEIIKSTLKIPSGHTYRKSILINYKAFSCDKIFNGQSYEPFKSFHYERQQNYYNIFDALDNEDILLHHPYDSYETVIKFLEHAAKDPNVEYIKQTLYRVSGIDSPIVNALCEASKNGKHVTVLVEIKARFDESNNIKLIDKLHKSGVNVILGDEYLKTHCKMCIVIRNTKNGIKIYSHVGTGNYNEKTSRIYTDLSFLTSKRKIGTDLLSIFNILSGHSKPDDSLKQVYYSPVNLRKKLISCIDREISYAKKGKKASIFIKVNSISDCVMVDKLYEAAKAGVKVEIICRGICSIVPRKNLTVKSIVGRFLEHSRIYYFGNKDNPEYYISSADLLTRNLDRRVETLIHLKDPAVIEQLHWIITVLKSDEANSFIENEHGKWSVPKGKFDAHDWLIKYSDVKKIKKK